MVQMFVRTVVRMRVIVSYTLYIYIYLAQYFFVRILVSCLTLFFLVVVTSLFLFSPPLLCCDTPVEWRYFNVL